MLDSKVKVQGKQVVKDSLNAWSSTKFYNIQTLDKKSNFDKILRRNIKSCLKSPIWSTHEMLLSSIVFKTTTFDNKLWLYSWNFPPNSCLKLLHPIATYPTSLTTAESRRSACRRKYFWTESRILALPFDHSSSDRGLFEVRKLWANSYY